MDTLRPFDWFCAMLVIGGLWSYLGFEWWPGLLLFFVGAVGVVVNAARWESS